MRYFSLLFLVAIPAYAQERTHIVTPEDYFSLNTVMETSVSHDGKHVVYSLSTWDKAEDNRKSDLWIVPNYGKGPAQRLTFDRANDHQVRWSVNGESIYFLGNRKKPGATKAPFDGSTQIWKLKLVRMFPENQFDLEGLEPQAITKVEGGVTGFDYSPLAHSVFYSTDKTFAEQDEFAKLRAKTKLEYGHGVRKVSEIHKLNLSTWRSEKVVDELRYVRSFATSIDGNRIAMISALDDSVIRSEGESRVDIWEGGKVTTPSTDSYRKNPKNSPYAWLENLCWNHTGTRFAFTAVHDAFPAEVITVSLNGSEWNPKVVDRKGGIQVVGYGRGLGNSMNWVAEDELSFLGEQTGSVGFVYHNATSGSIVSKIEKGKVINGASLPGGKLLPHLESSPTSFGKIVLPAGGAKFPERELFDPNPHTANWKVPSVKHITWKAPDGTEVGGVLELPYGYQKGEKLPLVVAIHGGPTTSTKADLSFDPHNGRLYFAAAGYAVLLPNYRGSTGYGDKFITDLIGKENDIEVKDILAGIQHLVKEGIADENRVGCMGWSNGGYLTNCLITLKDSPIKFKAASSGAGIVDTVAEWGFNDEPAYPIVFKKGLPWEQPEIYKMTSPTYQLGNVKTPTLVHVGGGDERCPPGHSRMLYRALKENLKVPTELLVYPGEPHGLTKMSNRKAKMEWDLAWFGKYLKEAK
jgi:dipeptidyl aminopeptidase/acylaminoacyl peptidase